MLLLMYCSSNAQQGNPKSTTTKKDTMSTELPKTEGEWKKKLSDEQYYVLREKGTERPFTGKFYLHKDKGVYTCAACGNELFTSDMKFDSHCGWPSFDREIKGGKIKTEVDSSHGMIRTEIMCAKCGGHLGHLFNDGPTETGIRYCVNSLSLEFAPEKNK
jgi:methionine-R-sulfoxide reductase